jgi:hypothetical protein
MINMHHEFQYGYLTYTLDSSAGVRWVFSETGRLEADGLLSALNELGALGWELVCFQDDRYIMKKSICVV